MSESEGVTDKLSWWDLPEQRWRLYVQIPTLQGYYLLISAPPPNNGQIGPRPFPFLIPAATSILEQIEKPETEVDVDRVEVALMRFDADFLSRVRDRLKAGKSRQARLLWIEQDPRFDAITDSMWERFARILRPSRGPRKGQLTLFVEQYLKTHDVSGKLRSALIRDIYFAAKRDLDLDPDRGTEDRRAIRDVLNKVGANKV